MQSIEQALEDVRALHEAVTRSPAPEIAPQAFLPIPPGHDPVAFAIEEVTQLKQMLQDPATTAPGAAQTRWIPRTNIYADESRLSFIVELPGVAKDGLSVTVSAGELVIRGSRGPIGLSNGLKPVLVEQACGNFERRFPVPAWCTSEAITARYNQGLLEIVLSQPQGNGSGEFSVEIA